MIDGATRDGLMRQRASRDWPYPYAPHHKYGLPPVWRGIVLTDAEWKALEASTPQDMKVWEPRPLTTWAAASEYWKSRAATRDDVIRIVDEELHEAPAAKRIRG